MADVEITDLNEATQITPGTLFVVSQSGVAMKLTGQLLINWMTSYADGHGGIQTIAKVGSSGSNPVVDEYKITYSDGSYSTFNITNGVKGDQGPAASVTSNVIEYQGGDSYSTPPTGTWQSSPPAVQAGKYLWTRTSVTFSDNTTVTSYAVARQGMDGSGAVASVCNVSPDGNGNVALTASNVSAVPTSGTDGFLYRSSNAVSQKELYKTLWTGTWSTGNIVCDTSGYTMFALSIEGYDTKITAYKSDDGSAIQGIGGFPYSSNTDTNYYFACSVSGTTLTLTYCRSRPSSGSTTNARNISKIVGII